MAATRYALATMGKGKKASRVVVSGVAKDILEAMCSGASTYQALMESGIPRNSVYMAVKRLRDAGFVVSEQGDDAAKILRFVDTVHLEPVSLL